MTDQTIGVQRERLPFTIVENAVFEDRKLKKTDLPVYWALCYHADREGKCFPGIRLLCKESRCSQTSLYASLKRLAIAGYIIGASRMDAAGDRASNLYTIKGLRGVVQSGTHGVVQSGTQGVPIRYKELDSLNQTKKSLSPSAPVSASGQLDNVRAKSKTSPPARKKSTAEKTTPPEGYSEFVKLLLELHERVTGSKYAFTARDGKQIKSILGKLGKSDAADRLRRYYTGQFWFTRDGHSLGGFIQHVNELGSGQSKASKAQTPDEIGAALFGRAG
jgi:hypothetical protein